MRNRHRDFDGQARTFDRRAGLPQAACSAIALELLRVAALAPTDVLLEVGAGTGQIGHALCANPLRYIGIDSSPAMLAEFNQRCREKGNAASVAVADASRVWPVRDASVTVVFGSRSLHLLPLQHVVDEAVRVATPRRSYLLIGRVERDPNGLRARLRREMRARLASHGHTAGEGQQREKELLDAFVRRGARPIGPRVAAAWPVPTSAGQVLASWRAKSGLAGVDVSPAEKEAVLSELTSWAEQTIGSLDTVETNEEKYMLAGVQLPAASRATASP